ncbi:DNA methyltransferase [Falsiroseomonas sp.]|uniref:DNA methyltransferase n=1 Tax=Falsiroseomonas sp. TaxID=2870721 RepID=UPI00273270B7|nr:DNA methyltransferase [Falsiroseomonas sp.]MDP3417873.1 DNA methyltransferase [Falsiroseomonas sp.]
MDMQVAAGSADGLLDRAAYLDFLRGKFRFETDAGFVVDRARINPMLKPHQVDLVEWMVRKGRCACFAAFGLGKSFIQLEVTRLVQEYTGGRCLIVLPLGVRQEFTRDAAKLGITVAFVRRSDDVGGPGIYLTNYESVRDGKLDVALFEGASLDEASVLRGYGTKTFQEFLILFASTPFRFVATATPSPNEHKELIHYAGFLGVMDTGQALTRFFQRDSEKAGNLTLMPHMEREFWLWLHSWAAFVQKPSDLGHDDAGYTMPPLVVRVHYVQASDIAGGTERDGQHVLIRDAALGLKEAATEKRESIAARVAKMAEIIQAAPDDHFILWHDLEAERHAIKHALPEAMEVYGSLDLDERERRVLGFSDGAFKYLATKPVVSGSGCNFQRFCHRAIFLGIGYKFNDFIQAIHRIRRFLQPHQCEVDIIVCETEREVWRDLERKWMEHDALTERMGDLIAQHGLSTLGLERELARTIGVLRREEAGRGFVVAHNDTVLECDALPSNSQDLIVTSIPFGNHYEYSASYEDFGHNQDHAKFFDQMGFLTPNLLRILKPGRIFACHVKDRIRFGNVTGMGMPTVEPFHADCIQHYRRAGFAYMGLIFVETDVVRENNQTYRLGWTEQCKDGTKMGVGSPEFILLFRKLPTDTSTAYADVPVVKTKQAYSRGRWQIDANAKWRSSGDRFLTAEEWAGYGPGELAKAFRDTTRDRLYSFDDHVAVAEALDTKGRLPSTFASVAAGSHRDDVFDDIARMRTLNGQQAQRNLQQHICPLQLDVVDRLIERYSNPGEQVFDPFGGLFTVPYCAIKLGRCGRAVELNPDYFRDGLRHLRELERDMSTPSLFDVEGLRGTAVAA